jgi:hypothetical protein
MRDRSTRNARLAVAIEVTRTRLYLVALEQVAKEQVRVRTRSLVWRQDCKSLHSELGRRELTAALARLASQEKLINQHVSFTLNSDYCVTRVVTGSQDKVRHELELLAERAELYLRLGQGPKVLSRSVLPLDARHQHALVTVTNHRTVAALVAAAEQARLTVDRIEPSTTALCRCLASGGHDADEPVLVVTLGEREVGLAVSYRGRLLLDFRPGGDHVRERIGQIIGDHLQRLERFCGRVCGRAGARIRRIYLSGPPDAVADAAAQFAGQMELKVAPLTPLTASQPAAGAGPAGSDASPVLAHGAARVTIDAAGDDDSPELAAALGTCLIAALPTRDAAGPNLIEAIRAQHQERLRGLLARTLWPAAAAALVVGTFLGLGLYERIQGAALASQIRELAPARARVAALRAELLDSQTMSQHLRFLQQHTSYPAQDVLLVTIARCLPADVWLDRCEIDSQGRTTLRGSSLADEGVFEFVRWLGSAPGVDRVQLEGTTKAQSPLGTVTKFEVQFEAIRVSSPSGGTKSTNESDSKSLSVNRFPPTNRHNRNFGAGAAGHLARRR